MRGSRIGFVALLGALIAGCGTKRVSVPLEQRTGTLRFHELVPDTRGVVFEGTVTLGDTIRVTTASGPCVAEVPGRRTLRSEVIAFECPDARVYLNRLNLEQRSSYQVRTMVRTARRVCDEYGPRGCVRYSTDYTEELAWRGGQLRLAP